MKGDNCRVTWALRLSVVAILAALAMGGALLCNPREPTADPPPCGWEKEGARPPPPLSTHQR